MAKMKVARTQIAEPAKTTSTRQERAVRTRLCNAYELLAGQPVSLVGLSVEERNNVVVSAVLDEANNIVVISRVGDPVWEMWPYFSTPNTPNSMKRLGWSAIPETYREACQNVLYHYWKVGRPGMGQPAGSMLLKTLLNLGVFCRFVASLELESLADVQPLHIANFVHRQKSAGLVASTMVKQFAALELLYHFRDQHKAALRVHPWPESSAAAVAGQAGQNGMDAGKASLTPLIPVEVARRLFLYAEDILACAEKQLDERDSEERSAFSGPGRTVIRDACFYLLGVLTGMRSSELSSIEVSAGRTEVKNGIVFHWIAAIEYKTKKGHVEYLMPAMGHRILCILERWSQPYRERLAKQVSMMERKSQPLTPKQLQWLITARSNVKRLFLGNAKGGLVPVSSVRWGTICADFSRAAGVDWKLAPHQMRRLYAYTFVRHRLGDMLFLKEQFKHSSIDMTQLYGSNPLQDAALYDDILSELIAYKAGVVAQWLEKDEPLAGGAAPRLMEMRAHDFGNRKELLIETSRRVNMRSTGHSWCLAQDEGCGGSGIYAKGTCGDCRNGVIDRRFIPIWQEAYRHHKELRMDAQELGPGVVMRVERDLYQAAKILKDLGVEVDAEEGDGQIAPR
ncbi:tyrosine-type recombinase/integrase [Comamonas sp. lk]|uniref:tyrosine-type recombinase/integrase n=1 Tax=Comamonas sp. lk TaxID=2201272 RepID=UPI000EAEF6F0|nr:tyrosine-type recombinase/integrase [Comamonas sp. lk]